MLNGSLFSSGMNSSNIGLNKDSCGKSFFADFNSSGSTNGAAFGSGNQPISSQNNTSIFASTNSNSIFSQKVPASSSGSSHKIATIDQPIMSDFQHSEGPLSSSNRILSPLAPPARKKSISNSSNRQVRFSPYKSALSSKLSMENLEGHMNQSPKSSIRHSMSMDFRSHSRLHTDNLVSSGQSGDSLKRHINRLIIRDPSQDSPLTKSKTSTSFSVPPSPNLVSLKKAEVKRSAIENGYWIFPPFSKLSKYTPNQLSAVSGLMIGRKGHGQITFCQPVDLSNLSNLGDILGGLVVFDDRMVCVYPDESRKALEGTELNVPAIVSLENCAPRDKKSGTIVTEPSNPIIQMHVSRLNDSLHERGGEHLTYDIKNGIWSFKVPHFSQWGGGEYDYEIEEPQKMMYGTRDLDSDLIEYTDADININDTFAHKVNKNHSSSVARPFSSTNFFETPNMDYDDNLNSDYIDGMEVHELPLQEYSQETPPEEVHEGENFVSENEDIIIDDDDELLDIDELQPPDLGGTPLSRDMSEDSADMLFESHKKEPTTWSEQLMQAAILSSRSSEIQKMDPAKLNKVLFGGADVVAETDTYTYMSAADVLRLPDISKNFPIGHFSSGTDFLVVRNSKMLSGMGPKSLGYRNANTKYLEVLEKLITKSTITNSRSSNILPITERSVRVSFAELADHFASETTIHEAELWQLASILFDEVHQIGLLDSLKNLSENVRTKIVERHRKRLLSDWLKDYVRDSVSEDLKKCENDLEKIYILLTGHQISEATELALRSGNFHLATIIPLLGSEDKFMRSTAESQIEDWIHSGSIDHIPDAIVKIFELAAGECTVSKARVLRLSDDLDWKRSFGLRLWYGTLLSDDISTVLDLYNRFLNEPRNSGIKIQRDASKSDIAYWLLNVYKSESEEYIKTVLDLSCQQWGMDYRIPWFIYSLLPQKYVPTSLQTTGDSLHANYGLQLLSMNHWIDAIFVLSHIQRDDIAQQHICRALAQHSEKIHDTENAQNYLDMLTDTLHVPRSVIFELDALRLRWKGDHTEEIWSLVQADMWEEAHQTLVGRVAPRAVIQEETESLIKILQDFKHSAIANWKVGGGMYYNFAELMRITTGSVESQQIDQITDLVKSLIASLSDVSLETAGNPEVPVAVSIMSAYVFSTALKFTVSITDGSTMRQTLTLQNIGGSQLLRMKMSKNDYFRYTLDLSVQYFQNKTY